MAADIQPGAAPALPDVPRAGVLSVLDLTEQESKLLVSYLDETRGKGGSQFLFLSYFLGRDLTRFLDTFSGETLVVPKRDWLLSLMKDVQTFSTLVREGYPLPDPLQNAELETLIAKRRGIARDRIPKIYAKFDAVLNERTTHEAEG